MPKRYFSWTPFSRWHSPGFSLWDRLEALNSSFVETATLFRIHQIPNSPNGEQILYQPAPKQVIQQTRICIEYFSFLFIYFQQFNNLSCMMTKSIKISNIILVKQTLLLQVEKIYIILNNWNVFFNNVNMKSFDLIPNSDVLEKANISCMETHYLSPNNYWQVMPLTK